MSRSIYSFLITGAILPLATLFLLKTGTVDGGTERPPPESRLRERVTLLQTPDNGIIRLISREVDGHVEGVVEASLSRPYESVRDVLRDPASWCRIILLHINTKTCTYTINDSGSSLSVYMGRKFYEPPYDAVPIHYRFGSESSNGRIRTVLTAHEGPLGTSDYMLSLFAFRTQSDRTGITFRFSYRNSTVTRMAMDLYFQTMARDKVGFSRVAAGEEIRGARAALERNVLRYYLAIVAYLMAGPSGNRSYPDTDKKADDRNDGKMWEAMTLWFDLTELYPRQLHELSRKSYLHNKMREWENQKQLQLLRDKTGEPSVTRTLPSPTGIH